MIMLYLIGLGLNEDGISVYGLEVAKKCKKVYLENYTVDFPYSIGGLKEMFGKKFVQADREFVESLKIIDEAEKTDVALLIYGSPLTATTHITLIDECKKSGIRYKVIYGASILDAMGETGLQIYKFGKITSMPQWKKSYTPDSFMDVVLENKSIHAHTLILCDIGLDFYEAMKQLKISAKNKNLKLQKIVVCQALGTKKRKIRYDFIEVLEGENFVNPYCLIIPGKLNDLEKEFLEDL